MASTGAGGAPAVKGLRLITMSKGPDGYGFHMYTDKKLQVRFLLLFFLSCFAYSDSLQGGYRVKRPKRSFCIPGVVANVKTFSPGVNIYVRWFTASFI